MKYSILSIFSILFFASCETVVHLELEEGNKMLVSEANIQFSPDSEFGTAKVYLTETSNFFSEVQNPPISGATIVVNNEYVLVEQSDSIGYYTFDGIPKEIGADYQIEITANIGGENGVWLGTDQLMKTVQVDSTYVIYKPAEGGPFSEDGYYLKIAFQEPGDEVNFYHQNIEVLRNDSLKPFESLEYNEIYDDAWVNGQYLDFEVNRGRAYQIGDTINFSFSSITESSYMFYDNVNQLLFETVGIGAAPPFPLRGNLVSQNENLENALGNFKVSNTIEEVIIIE